MQDTAIERLAKIISEKQPDGGGVRRRMPSISVPFGLAEGWFSLFLLATVVYSTIWCVQAVGWVEHLGILSLTTALGLIAGLIAAKQHRFPRLVIHPLAVILGILIAFWQTAGADYAGNTLALANGMHQWFVIALGGGASNDDSIFLFFITALGFLLAYISAWLLYRTRSPWLLIVANAIVMLINLSNVDPGFIVFLIVFLIASLLLLLRFNLHESVQRWRRQRLRYSDELGWDFMQAGALISIGVLVFSWLLPWGYVNDTASQIWNAKTNPWQQLENTWNRLISVSGGFTPANHGNFTDTLLLGGNPNLNNDIVFTVQSNDGTQYLQSLSYDTYDGRGWKSSPTYSLSLKANQVVQSESALWRPVQQTVTVVNAPGEQYPYLFGASQIATVDMPALVLTSASNGAVVTWLTQNGGLAAGERYTLTSYVSAADTPTLLRVPFPADSPSLPPYNAPPPVTYYDPSILHSYLQLPNNLDANILRLARTIVAKAGAKTMYDQAAALASYLQSSFTYDVNIHLPPGEEGVSWFLFRSGQRGFCNYFASAMTVMARLLGIPARVAVGYTNGQFDAKHHQWVIRGNDAHSWTQIYFAGYGWVNFEPSAGFPSISRPPPGTTHSTGSLPPGGQGTPITIGRHGVAATHPDSSDVNGTNAITTPAQAQAQFRQRVGLTLGSVILLVLFGLILFIVWWRRLFRNYRISAQIYGRICVLANWAGVSIQRSQTPYEYIQILTRVAPEQATALERFGDIYVRDLWADPESTEHPRRSGEIGELLNLWKRLQPAFFAYVVRHPYFLRWLPSRLSNFISHRRAQRRAQQLSEQEEAEDDGGEEI